MKPLRIMLLGPPGVGKGTYAEYLSKHYQIPHISTGDLFRERKITNSEFAKQIQQLDNEGKLYPDQMTLDLVAERLAKNDCQNGYILDGFPRTLNQANNFNAIDLVLEFQATQETIIDRLSGRRTCKSCKKIYHIKNNPPPKPNTCICGTELFQRNDDQPEKIKKRLKVYEEKTKPLTEFYQTKNLLQQIDANGKIEDIINRCYQIIDKMYLKNQLS